MKFSRFFLTISLVSCLLALPLVEAIALQKARPPAETGITDWNNLQRLGIWDKVEVVRHSLSKQKGKVLARTEESITLRLKNRDVTIPREEVYRVTQLSRSRRGRNALAGFIIGATVGMILGGLEEGTFKSDGKFIARLAVSFGGIGAGVGAAFPSHPTVYRVPRREP